jgi:hypothetical protein
MAATKEVTKERELPKVGPVEDDGMPVVVRREPEMVLQEWRAPVRVYKKRSKQFWTTAFMMAFLVGLIMFFVEGWMPVAVVIAFMFLTYVMSSIPPEEVTIQLTSRGVKLGDNKYLWGEMIRFWISERWGQKLVSIDLMRLPGRLTLLLGPMKEEVVKETVSKYLQYEEAKPTWIEKASTWLGKKFPLEVE